MKPLSLTVAVAGVLALGVSGAMAFPINIAASKAEPSNIAKTQWHGTQWINPRCVRPNWSRRCRWYPRPSGAWPSIPRCYPDQGVCTYPTAPDLDQWHGWN
jgi:hypothetical protein